MMSAVTAPTILFAIGADAVRYRSTIAVSAASLATSCVTITLRAVTDLTSFDWWSITRSMSVMSRPKDDALVSNLPLPSKFGQMYGAWVWPLTITSTCGSRPWAIALISSPPKLTQRLTSV